LGAHPTRKLEENVRKKSACIVAHDKTHKEKKKGREREREVNT
jgi:hypothetical protein